MKKKSSLLKVAVVMTLLAGIISLITVEVEFKI